MMHINTCYSTQVLKGTVAGVALQSSEPDAQDATSKGTRVDNMSYPYKAAVVEAFLISGMSERKFPHTHALLAYFT